MTPRSPFTPLVLSPGLIELAGGRSMFQPAMSDAENLISTASREDVRSIVQSSVDEIIGEEVKSDQPLMEAGIDSLAATELQQKLADELSVELPSTLVFDYPTVDSIIDFLMDKLDNAGSMQRTSGFDRVSRPKSSTVDIAIASAAGQHVILQQWSQGDASNRVPIERWDVDSPFLVDSEGGLPAQFGIFMKDVDKFDSEVFGLMRSEAHGMDPQQRLLLLQTYDALSQAGGLDIVFGRQSGAFVGIAATDYDSLSHRNGVGINAFSFTSASPSVASGRISYVFAARGAAVSIDTACSASLVATHMACSAFRESPQESAIAAGVLLCLVPESTLMLTRAQMISPEGRSKTLDASADGYARGEACRTVVLRPGSMLTDQDDVYGWVACSSVNTNGRASSLTAPNGPSQQQLLREAWIDASAGPNDVLGIQLHSNGTSLGDPIEIGAISAVAFVSDFFFYIYHIWKRC